MIDVIISNSSGKPIYQQLFDQISAQIIKGKLNPGQSLPPIRTAAKELRVSIITVKKAWEELERKGFINSVVGRGCFVADLNRNDLADKRDDIVIDKLIKDIKYYKDMGMTLEEIIKAVKEAY